MRDPFEPQIRCLLCFGASSDVMAIDLYKDTLGYSRDRNPCLKRKHHILLSVIHLPSGGYTLCVFGLVNTYRGEGLEFVFPEFVRLLKSERTLQRSRIESLVNDFRIYRGAVRPREAVTTREFQAFLR